MDRGIQPRHDIYSVPDSLLFSCDKSEFLFTVGISDMESKIDEKERTKVQYQRIKQIHLHLDNLHKTIIIQISIN